MKLPFQDMLGQAARLVRSGRLRDATQAIQDVLGNMPGARRPPSRATPPARAAGAAADVIDIDARVVDERRHAPDAPPAASPGPAPTADAFLDASFRNEHGTRDYKLFIPAAPGSGAARPLLVMLHGCTQDPDDFARGTAMNELARRDGFLVLYPAQSRRANPSRCWNWFKHTHQARGRGEPAILAGMIEAVAAEHRVDKRRVFVAGLSAGGAMAAILGDAYPDLVAAVGIHSGLPTGAARDAMSAFTAMRAGASAPEGARRAPAPPTIVFHGDADTTVNPVNAERAMAAAMPGATAEEAREAPEGKRATTRGVYRAADGTPRGESWIVHGAGHAWSGGRPEGSFTDPAGPDASAEMLRFFLAHPMPGGAASA